MPEEQTTRGRGWMIVGIVAVIFAEWWALRQHHDWLWLIVPLPAILMVLALQHILPVPARDWIGDTVGRVGPWGLAVAAAWYLSRWMRSPFGPLLLAALSWATIDWAFRQPPGPLREDRLTQSLMGLAILATLVALAFGWGGFEPGDIGW